MTMIKHLLISLLIFSNNPRIIFSMDEGEFYKLILDEYYLQHCTIFSLSDNSINDTKQPMVRYKWADDSLIESQESLTSSSSCSIHIVDMSLNLSMNYLKQVISN